MYKLLRAKAWQELSACIKTDPSALALFLSYSFQFFTGRDTGIWWSHSINTLFRNPNHVIYD